MTPTPELHELNRNGLWNRVIVDALVDSGVRDVALCPGGRSSVLSLILHRTAELACRQFVDERGAAFAMLGLIAASGRPAAVCTTSGSAVANLLPALSEAHARGLPLVLLTCDRPLAVRRPREPQCMPQLAISLPLLHAQLALPDPTDEPSELRNLRRSVLTLLRDGASSGPVQINVPQHGRQCASEVEPGWRAPVAPRAVRSEVGIPAPRPAPTASTEEVEAAAAALGARPGLKGLIVAGGNSPLPVDEVVALARATGFPLLADVTSGLRCHDVPGVVSTGDALVRAPGLELHEAEFILRLGDAPVSSLLQDPLSRLSCATLRIAHDPGPDFVSPTCQGVTPPSPEGVAALAARLGPGDPDWSLRWQRAEAVAVANRERFVERLPWGEVRAADLICNAPGFDFAHLANSLAVRHASLMSRLCDRPRPVFANRGVNGTDGTLGTFLGELIATESRGVALLGDQAAAHDLSSLANAAWSELRGAICVLNNGGAGIFDLIACSRIDGYERTMRNPPVVDFAGVAKAFGLPYRRCVSVTTLEEALADAAEADAVTLVEARVPATVAREMPRLVRAMVVGVADRAPLRDLRERVTEPQ